mgnify:CR=1 FL=1
MCIKGARNPLEPYGPRGFRCLVLAKKTQTPARAPQGGGGAFAPYKRFAAGETLADCARRRVSERNRRSAAALGAEMAEFTSAEHWNHRRVERAIGPQNPKRKT